VAGLACAGWLFLAIKEGGSGNSEE